MDKKVLLFGVFFFFVVTIFLSGCVTVVDSNNESNDSEEESEDFYYGCHNEECVKIEGTEEDECTENADCVESDEEENGTEETYLACVEGQCKEIVGSEEDSCSSDLDCVHTECSLFECVEVNEAGDDQCTENSECYEVIELDFPVAVTANMPSTNEWQICMFTTGAWDTVDLLCRCNGYSGLGPRDGGPACYFEDMDESYDWNVDESSCEVTNTTGDLGDNRVLTKVRCLVN